MTGRQYWLSGMSTVVAGVEPRVADLHVTEAEISAGLVDGRTVSVPHELTARTHWSRVQQRHPNCGQLRRRNIVVIG